MQRSILRFRYWVLAVLTCILLGCSGTADNTVREIVSSFKVAAVLSGEINDAAWSQAVYQGLERIEQQLVAQVAYTSQVKNLPATQTESILKQYAGQQFDFVIGQSSEYIPLMETVAQEFPRTKFAVVDAYSGNNANFGSLSFRNGELGYLAGTVAALKTKTNRIAFVGGAESASARETATLFERGAKATNPDLMVTSLWMNGSTTAAEQIAQTEIQAGSDVLLVYTDQTNTGIHQVAEQMGVHTIGWIDDEYDLAPNAVLTSGIQRIPELLLQGATQVRQGRWEGKQYRFGLREGVQDLAPFRGALTAAEIATVHQVREDILTGKLDISL